MRATADLLKRQWDRLSVAWSPRALVLTACALAFALAAFWLAEGRGLTFYFDEWDFVQGRREWDADALLAPHNGHVVLVPALIYKLLFEIFGLWVYTPYRAVGLAAHLATVSIVYAYARSRLGAVGALVPAVMLLCFGPGWADILWPFQIGFLVSLGAGVGALLFLERDDEAGQVLAAVLLVLCVASGSLGLPILAMATVEVLRSPERREKLWVVAVPIALYGAWYVSFSPESQTDLSKIGAVPEFVARSAAGSVGALLGGGQRVGAVALIVLLPLAGWRIWKTRPVPPRVWTLLATAVLLWTLIAFARAGLEEPDASRYLYPGAVLVLLLAVELVSGMRPTHLAAAGIAVGVIVTGGMNLHAMNRGFFQLGYASELTRGALAGLELAGPLADRSLRPEQAAAPQVATGEYLSAVGEYGSPAPAFDELPSASLLTQRSADQALILAYRLDRPELAVGGTGNDRPVVVTARGVAARATPACVQLRDTSGANVVTIKIPQEGLWLDKGGAGPAVLRLRRFAPDAGARSPIYLLAGPPVVLEPPPDPSARPWVLDADFPGNLTACGAP